MLHSYHFHSVQQRHQPARLRQRARPSEPAAVQRNRVWLRALVALLVVVCGTPGGPKLRLALVARRIMAAESPGDPQESSPQRRSQQIPGPVETVPSIPLSKKQKKDLLKDNFEKMKRDADQLAELAKSLQEDLNQSNENVLSLRVVDKAEKIEKLAKKIKGVARGY